MDYAEAITRLTRVESVEDGAELIVEYAEGISGPNAYADAMNDLGWLTGELLDEQRERVFKYIPGLMHPITGQQIGLRPMELIFAGARYAADHGGEFGLDRERILEARRKLGYG